MVVDKQPTQHQQNSREKMISKKHTEPNYGRSMTPHGFDGCGQFTRWGSRFVPPLDPHECRRSAYIPTQPSTYRTYVRKLPANQTDPSNLDNLNYYKVSMYHLT
jgi:hypothetical protein